MCRIFICVGMSESEETRRFLNAFHVLAEHGRVPRHPKIKPGHTEGWGMVAYKNGKIIGSKKRKIFAAIDAEYKKTVERMAAKNPDCIMAHFRKATLGKVSVKNCHPFSEKNFSFCHNGSIEHAGLLPISEEQSRLIRGQTDTEKFFHYFLQVREGLVRGVNGKPACRQAGVVFAIEKTVRFIRKNLDYTALNCLVTDGRSSVAVREVNEKNILVKSLKMLNDIELYEGRDKKKRVFLVCSEPLTLSGVKWKKIPNHTIISYDSHTHTLTKKRL